MVKTKSLGYRAGMTLIYALLALIALFCVIPFIHVIAASLSTPEYLASEIGRASCRERVSA